MPGFLAAALPAVGAGVASLLGQSSANRTNLRIAREQMAFQERMSGTAYQRATQDMRLAGINPMLAYMQGGASSPQGASTTVSDVVGPAVSSAMAAMRLRSELRMQAAELEGKQLQNTGLELDNAIKGAVGEQLASVPVGGAPVEHHLLAVQLRLAQLRNIKAMTRSAQLGGDIRSLPATLSRGLSGIGSLAGEGYQRAADALRRVQSGADRARQSIFNVGSAANETLLRARKRRRNR